MCVNLSNAGVFGTVQLMETVLILGGQLSIVLVNLLLAYSLIVLDILDLGLKSEQVPMGTFGLIALITFAVSSSFFCLFDEAGDAIM